MADVKQPNVNYSGPSQSSGTGLLGDGKSLKGQVKVDKPSLKEKVTGFLFSDKIDSIASYLASYILGPSLKDLVFKMGLGALQMSLYGGTNSMVNPNNAGSYGTTYGYPPVRRDPIPYNTMAQPIPGYNYGYGVQSPVQQPMMAGQFGNTNSVSFDSKDAALVVLDRMKNVQARYGRVRVADFYDSAEITGYEANWTLQGNGWYDLSGAQPVLRTDGRWMLSLPPVRQL